MDDNFYVLQVSNLRGHPTFTLYQAGTSGVDVSEMGTVVPGTDSGFTLDITEPNGTSTFTLVVSQP